MVQIKAHFIHQQAPVRHWDTGGRLVLLVPETKVCPKSQPVAPKMGEKKKNKCSSSQRPQLDYKQTNKNDQENQELATVVVL